MTTIPRLAAALLGFAAVAVAQEMEEPAPEQLQKQLAEKLARPFVTKVAWVQDFDQARRLARETNKPIFAYFTRSFEACPGSDQVEGGVFLTDEFKTFAARFVPFFHVTSLLEGRKDDTLLLRLGRRSFPTVLILDEYGGVLAEHRSAATVEAFGETAAPALRRFELRAKALAGDRDAAVAYALERAERDQITSRELRREMERRGPLSEAEQERYRAALTTLLVGEAELFAQGEWYARMEKEGLVPEDLQTKLNFYVAILGFAEYREDTADMGRILALLRKVLADHPEAEGFLQKAEEKLKDLETRLAAEAATPGTGDAGASDAGK